MFRNSVIHAWMLLLTTVSSALPCLRVAPSCSAVSGDQPDPQHTDLSWSDRARCCNKCWRIEGLVRCKLSELLTLPFLLWVSVLVILQLLVQLFTKWASPMDLHLRVIAHWSMLPLLGQPFLVSVPSAQPSVPSTSIAKITVCSKISATVSDCLDTALCLLNKWPESTFINVIQI